jgi:hypothetical protein
MTDARKRAVFRWVHIVFDIPIVGYVHSPLKQLPNYVGYIALPAIVLSGLWISERPPDSTTLFKGSLGTM